MAEPGDAVVKMTLVLLLASACESPHVVDRTKTPSSTAVAAHVSVRCVPTAGAHVKVTRRSGAVDEGELLAASANGLTLLVSDQLKLDLKARDIERAEINLYSNGTIVGLLTLWAVVGTVSTLSHGAYFVFTAPSWALVSTLAIAPVAGDPDRFVSVTEDLGQLHEYARFPGGMPSSFDPERAHMVASPCD